jgi:Secretion system C-terminal sorting domain
MSERKLNIAVRRKTGREQIEVESKSDIIIHNILDPDFTDGSPAAGKIKVLKTNNKIINSKSKKGKKMKKVTMFLVLFLILGLSVFAQSDFTSETKTGLNSNRRVSGNENSITIVDKPSSIPQNLLNEFIAPKNNRNEEQKILLGKEIDRYLTKPVMGTFNNDIETIPAQDPPFNPDWYDSDIMVTNSEIVSTSGFRQIELKQGEDGWMYMAVNRSFVPDYNGYVSLYRSSNGGASWANIINYASASNYYGSVTLLVESRNNTVADSTRLIIYFNLSPSANMNDASVFCCSVRRNGTASYAGTVGSPAAGNRFVYPTSCSDGMYFSGATYMHLILREETNSGTYVALKHFRSVDWGVTHSVGTLNTISNDKFPASAFSIETGTDSIYIAVEREISANEREIRLVATTDAPTDNFRVRYVTDAAPGTLYQRPDISIQQRAVTQPQHILVTSTKNNRAVYHFSQDGGASWTVDASLGLANQLVDYTSCNSDSLTAGGSYFIAAYVDMNGDSVSVRRGILGLMGTLQHKVNTNSSSGVISPSCAIYREGSEKFSAYSYAGYGPSKVFYNMQSLITGITQINSSIPAKFNLSQNYPNPFNPVTNIEFSLPNSSAVKLVVFDILGKEIGTLINEQLKAGVYKADWNAANHPSGVYFYRLTAGGFTETKKMLLVK